MADFLAAAEKAIPAEVHMISGCMDSQTSADVSNVASFSLPDPAGKAGGALTSSLLKVLYSDHHAPAEDLSFQDVLTKVRATLSGRYTQIPQLSSSRPMDISSPFEIVPKGCTGTKRALLIGINYIGQKGELSGCHNDVLNMVEYLKDVHGFESQNITLLLDTTDGQHTSPTHANILSAYRRLVAESAPGDAVYCHYSGHGGKLRDDDGDEKDGYDETLVPLDYQSAGQIRDDDLFNTLVGPMRKGVTLTCIMDCCHSEVFYVEIRINLSIYGTILDLPYTFKADGQQTEMTASADFDMQPLLQLAAALASGASLTEALSSQDPQQLMSIAQQCCTIL